MLKNLSLRVKIMAGSCIPLVLFVILGVISLRGINSLTDSNEWVDHTHTVMAEASAIESSGVDMETGMRGYLLAGKEEFLGPYQAGQESFSEKAAGLKKTVDDNPAQVKLLQEVEATIGEWQENVTEPTIALRRDIGDAQTMNDMADLVGEAKGKVYFDKFRRQIATFAGREEALMAERKKTAESTFASAEESIKAVTDTTGWVVHTYEVIAQANEILALAVDMETGMRGFLLAGKEEFLDPYKQGQEHFSEELAKLKKTVDDNPAQVKLLDEVEANIREWNDKVTEPAIALRRQVGDGKTMDDIASLVGEARGKQYFDKVRGQIATFIEREVGLLEKRQEEGSAAAASVASSIKTLNDTTKWVGHTHEVIAEAKAILASAVDMETGMRGYLLAGQEGFLDPYNEGQKQFTEKVAALQKTVDDNPAQVQLLGEAAATINEWKGNVTEPTIALRREIGDSKTMDDMADRVGEARGKVYFDKFREQIATFRDREAKLMGERQEAAVATASQTKTMIYVGTAAAIVLSLIISLFLTRSITGPLNRVIYGLSEGSNQVNDAAAQVSSSSQQLAEGASEQASSLEETSGALEEMAAMTRTNAENARQANELSDQAKTAAQSGDQTMVRLNEAMTAINESSGQISKIIKVIEEIAFQTNLLALNAAVEAARAGDHGKGFAVVADEVRNLAQRAAQASREITGLIEGSVSKAREGTNVAEEVGKALGAIVGDVTKVADLITGITQASEEQAQGVDQVNTAVSQMDKVTQQNSSGAEESAAAAEELTAQAAAVKGMVHELTGVVGGTGTRGSVSSVAQGPEPSAHKARKRLNVNVAHAKKTQPAPVGTGFQTETAGVKATNESPDSFMSLDDGDELGEF